MNLFGGSSTKQRPDSEPRSLGDHGSVFRFLGSQLEGKILRGPMWSVAFSGFSGKNASANNTGRDSFGDQGEHLLPVACC